MKKNMSPLTNPFSLDSMRLPVSRIVDREQQIVFLNERVIGCGENVLVTGPFGIGKTCLLRKFRSGIPDHIGKRTLLIEMEMRRLSADASDFLSDVLLKLLGAFWEQVLKRPYSQLITALTNPAEVRERVLPHVRTVLETYRIVRPRSVNAALEASNVLGLEKLFTAKKEEKNVREVQRGDLNPSEFVSLADEILAALQENGVERIIIFGDEANHIDPDIEIEIIRRNFEVFARRNVQFVLTAKLEVLQKVPRLKDAFPAWLDVTAFEDPMVIDDIISIYSANANVPTFTPRTRQLIWRISGGNPREIQRLCQATAGICISRASVGGNTDIDGDTLVEAMAQLYELRPR